MTTTEAEVYGAPPGTFTDWEDLPESDLLFYEGLHGCIKTGKVDLPKHVDLKIGVVPVINLEWIQKIHRDKSLRGYSTEAVTETILRRMPDYARYICPQFSETKHQLPAHPDGRHVESVRSALDSDSVGIDAGDPFRRSARHRFPYLLSMLDGAFMSRANSIVCSGEKLDLAMQLIFTPLIHKLMDLKRRAS
jgi:phosphoribulokinase